MSGLSGPKAHEVRAGLGPDPASAGKLVLTPVQSGRSSRADKDADRQNYGFSGTPMWKIQQQLKKAAEDAAKAAAAAPHLQVPEGFVHHEGSLYWSEKRQVFWQQGNARFLVYDKQAGGLTELYEGKSFELLVSAGAACQDGPRQARHVLIRDLAKASQALRMPIDHLDRPCALYALYDGHRGPTTGGNACADFCAKHMHEKLLSELSEFRGRWDDERLAATMRRIFEALDAEFLEKHATTVVDGCAAAVALVTGNRLIVASTGDVACILCLRSGEGVELVKPHLASPPRDGDSAAAGQTFFLTRSFGDRDHKTSDAASPLQVTPEVQIVHLRREHQGFALTYRAVCDALGGATPAAQTLRRCAGRPRFAARAFLDAATGITGAATIAAFFDTPESSATDAEADAPPPAKRPRTEPTQVRIRHILLKHRDCKNPVDKVRGRTVTRSRVEAEQALSKVLQECEMDPQQRALAFAQRCRELSECPSSLRGGDMAGDLAWVRKGKMGIGFDEVAFALQVGQLSDLVDSDAGIHILWRTA